MIAEQAEDHSSLGAYDPYGRQQVVYKGMRLYEESDRKNAVSLSSFVLVLLHFYRVKRANSRIVFHLPRKSM
jgi:hypothetical protein